MAMSLFCLFTSEGGAAFGQPAFGQLESITNLEFRVRLTIPATKGARVDASTNLADWTTLLTAGAGSLVYTDTFAPLAPARFYRAEEIASTNLMGDHIPTTNGDLVIRPITHATFAMSWNGLMIYSDPVSASYAGLAKANLILVTHEHGDHFNAGAINTVKAAGAIIIAPRAVYNQLATDVRAITTVLTNGASTNLAALGIEVLALPAYNQNHAKGVGNGYVVTLGGQRIYISGDTGDIPETRALQNIDVAFLCMNQPFTMTVAQAAAVVKAFAPRRVYPYHYRNQDNSYSNLDSFKQQVGTGQGIEVRLRRWY